MLSIPIYIFLVGYLIVLAGIAILFFINVFHLINTGTITFVSVLVTVIFIVYSALILLITYQLLATVNWQTPLVINYARWFSGAGNYGL